MSLFHQLVRRIALSFVIISSLSLVFLVGCSSEEPEPRTVVSPAKIFTVGSGTQAFEFEYPGRVEPARTVELAFEVSGKIIDFPITVGSYVEKGEVIAELDSRDYVATRNAAASELTAAKNRLARVEELRKKDFASQQEVDEARRRVEVAASKLEQAAKGVEDTKLVALFDGRLASKTVEDFANIVAKRPIGELQEVSTLRVTINIPENDFSHSVDARATPTTASGLQYSVSISAFPGRSFEARLYEISTTADEQTGTYETTIEFDPPEDILILPGMTSTVKIFASGRQSINAEIAIPAKAVLADKDGNANVWVIDKETMTASKRSVEIGKLEKDSVAVLSGLQPGEVIAISGVHALREGMQVSEYK